MASTTILGSSSCTIPRPIMGNKVLAQQQEPKFEMIEKEVQELVIVPERKMMKIIFGRCHECGIDFPTKSSMRKHHATGHDYYPLESQFEREEQVVMSSRLIMKKIMVKVEIPQAPAFVEPEITSKKEKSEAPNSVLFWGASNEIREPGKQEISPKPPAKVWVIKKTETPKITPRDECRRNDTQVIVPPAHLMAPSTPPVNMRTLSRQIQNFGARQIAAYDDAVNKAFAGLDARLGEQPEACKYAKFQRKGRWTHMKRANKQQIIARKEEERKALEFETAFNNGDFGGECHPGHVNLRSLITKGEQVSFKTEHWHRAYKQQKGRSIKQRLYAHGDPEKVLAEVLKISARNNLKVEFIGKTRNKNVKCEFLKIKESLIPKIKLPHEEGSYRKRELDPANVDSIVRSLTKVRRLRNSFKDEDITLGWSGAILPKRVAHTNVCRHNEIVVRGRLYGRVIDARTKLPINDVARAFHYSSNELTFFQGWRKGFSRLLPTENNHECQISQNNEFCGQLAASISQIMLPCHKLSCDKCRESINSLTAEEYNEFIHSHIQSYESVIAEIVQLHPEIGKIVANFKSKTLLNPSVKETIEIQKLTQGNKATQMQQIHKLNSVLLKGSTATPTEFSEASASLLEIARWFNNHLNLITRGELSAFRNKRSSKALVNPSLLCDNQLDKNGNFIWGERGYHSKRFFINFFEEVIPGDGYNRYAIRRNPNGERKLAITNLIISMDFNKVREAFIGETVKKHPLTTACVCRRGNEFVYVCSCVTTDGGEPLFSEFKSPTKRHLVIGNTGDSKFIDLPPSDTDRMYVAKEGYCYLNIFLAMLLNVNEGEAKAFTKMVRDTLVPMLGTWPTMQDVATACYILTVFHPETRNAELPRILVDHTSKIMHVIDSFGSKTKGYHILKAGTISQLIEFAAEELQGEMKFYRVGGVGIPRKERMVEALIKGIYRPKQLVYIIQEDPYILLMSLVSPRLISELHNNGALELAIRSWITKDQPLSTIISLLICLAEKISRAEQLVEQTRLIGVYSRQILEVGGFQNSADPMMMEAKALLTTLVETMIADTELTKSGFYNMNTKLHATAEKIYGERLREEWRALTWLEKSSSIMFARKHRAATTSFAPQEKHTDLSGKHNISLKSLRGVVRRKLSGARTCISQHASRITLRVKKATVDKALGVIVRCYKDLFCMINVMIVMSLLFKIIETVHRTMLESQLNKMKLEKREIERVEAEVLAIYSTLECELGQKPTREEFIQRVTRVNSSLLTHPLILGADIVHYEAKSANEKHLEQVVAFVALVTMLYDSEKSDAVFKILNKLRTVFSTFSEIVRYQSLDDINSLDTERKLTIDFELDTTKCAETVTMDTQFCGWWQKQLDQNRTVPHYRTSGRFIEFTRQTAAQVCNLINCADEKEFLVRGAVGSGKSTGLPAGLAQKGLVLLLEPTRPLAENVCKQLKKEPFNLSPTLRMRGLTTFGASNINIMTSGFALHYYANNPNLLMDISFVMIDESHTLDASTMAFYCLLKEYDFDGKILKVSATPPGKECEFLTQHAVKIKMEDDLSMTAFVNAQGTGSNADVTNHGDNILVYVASYNDVDQLSKLLIEKKYCVTKVDGRTMKLGNVEIPTKGTAANKHFIVATNIIENGVTLDIEVVVDFGLKVVADLDTDSRCMRHQKVPVTYGERLQRMGRVGRVKPGAALRIGHTEKGMTEIPIAIATEAAFLCYAYGLPVMTHNVTTSLLSGCTVKQAKTMLKFELSPFYMVELVKFNGTMHPLVEKLLKPYKLRDSEIELSTLAIPNSNVDRWISIGEYKRMGIHIEGDAGIKIPFAARGIPDKLHADLWEVVQQNKGDAGFGRLSSVSASKVAYTLNTEPTAIPRTLAIIEQLLTEERQKKAHFESLNASLCMQSFTLAGIVEGVRKRYLRDHSSHNIEVLQRAKAQILEFHSLSSDFKNSKDLMGYGFLDTVQYQNKHAVSRVLGLKGNWNATLATKDVVVAGMVFFGGCWMAWSHFRNGGDSVTFQGRKRQQQKLKFRDARDKKVGREVYGDDGTIEHYFGEAYTKKGKTKGSNNTKGMGRKTRRFVNMYGFDPTEYNFVRFVDPITGFATDESVTADISLVQEEIVDMRLKALENDSSLYEIFKASPGIQAYFVKRGADEALRVDLTPHRPLAVGRNSASIAGFPERELEMRQTGQAVKISADEVPTNKFDEVKDEGRSIARGIRNYNPIATSVCQLKNSVDGSSQTVHGIGYGPIIITNSHLFKQNNGTLLVRSHHGEFLVQNTTKLLVHHVKRKDMILIRMPKDFPPFPMRLKFRAPQQEERACLVGSIFQEKTVSSCVSESTVVMPTEGGSYWKHWVSTKDGDCGLPMVSTRDSYILGFHGLTSTKLERNYFIPFVDDFTENVLAKLDSIEWVHNWTHSSSLVAWNGLSLVEDKPSLPFKLSKIISDLGGLLSDEVAEQGQENGWVYSKLQGNLKAVGQSTSQLVTKHVVNGPCMYFLEYCNEHPNESKLFQKFKGAYGPSRLNKEAFKKDFFKYSGVITVGEVDAEKFESAVRSVKQLLRDLDYGECKFVTDHDEIFDSLNMKAAVGALYSGKKQQFFEDYSDFDKSEIVKASCLRLYQGKMGVWNGSLKAELRPKEKLDLNKTRTFTAAPIDSLLGGKVCVDDFNNRFYSLNLVGPWTVGMTKFYGGWNNLLQQLPEGWIYCDADGSQFDSSLTPYLINAVISIREAFMEDWAVGKQMLRNFYTEIIYTPILTPDGTIVKKFKGNNSGQPSTVVDNTLMVVLAMYYSMHQANWSEKEMTNSIKFFANGDDLLIAIQPGKQDLLDHLARYFSELGLKYDFSSRHTNKENLWFMSHRGMLLNGMYIPKLEEERIVSILEWDRSSEIAHRAEAICASMIEAWGYPDLLRDIRKFYLWLMSKDEFKELAREGKMPYISETALKKLYTDVEATEEELMRYWKAMLQERDHSDDVVVFQGTNDKVKYQSGDNSPTKDTPKENPPQPPNSTVFDAGKDSNKNKNENKNSAVIQHDATKTRDVGANTSTLPRLNKISKMRMPMVRGKSLLNIGHLLEYKPEQTDLSNTRATRQQFSAWYDAVMREYEVNSTQMELLMNGLMVWCIENGTSPNINGVWVMMEGDEQVEYPLKPVIENAKPTFRQIMHHFSDAAEAYIEMRNAERPYMPRYGLQRNLRDKTLARYAFDFYEVTSRTTDRAREAHMQMKAAALANVSSKLFGLDGNVATTSEDTERHTAMDVSTRMHTLMGVRQEP